MTEPLTPVTVEAKLRALVTEMYLAQQELSKARDEETAALVEFRRAEVTAAHDPECPVPSRGGVTVGQREEWIAARVQPQWEALRWAENGRETAQERLRTVLAVATAVQSLNASVRAAYSVAGVAS